MAYEQPEGENVGKSSVIGLSNKPNINLSLSSSKSKYKPYKSGSLLKDIGIGGAGFIGGLSTKLGDIKRHTQVRKLGQEICAGSNCPTTRALGPGAYGGSAYKQASQKLGLDIDRPNVKQQWKQGLLRGVGGAALTTGLNLGVKYLQKKGKLQNFPFTFR